MAIFFRFIPSSSCIPCIHYDSDIFNLPLPALWTAVLGEYNRNRESGHERRVSVEKIITHSRYSHFDHDIGKFAHMLTTCLAECVCVCACTLNPFFASRNLKSIFCVCSISVCVVRLCSAIEIGGNGAAE